MFSCLVYHNQCSCLSLLIKYHIPNLTVLYFKRSNFTLSSHSDRVSTDRVSNSNNPCSKLLVLSTLTEIFSLSFLLYGILHSRLLTNGISPVSLSGIHPAPLCSNNSIPLSLHTYSHSFYPNDTHRTGVLQVCSLSYYCSYILSLHTAHTTLRIAVCTFNHDTHHTWNYSLVLSTHHICWNTPYWNYLSL